MVTEACPIAAASSVSVFLCLLESFFPMLLLVLLLEDEDEDNGRW
ncbi:hypothetical protein NC651_026760 [Populus alba x Populus x berolinensis]|nr:hypothetical protein NC651_026760 [Populus alba x Populus x berolinensis]